MSILIRWCDAYGHYHPERMRHLAGDCSRSPPLPSTLGSGATASSRSACAHPCRRGAPSNPHRPTPRTWVRVEWDWMVRGYYGPGGRAGTKRNPNRGRVGEREGDLAIETVHKGDSSKDAEVSALEARPDIGTVQVIRLRH